MGIFKSNKKEPLNAMEVLSKVRGKGVQETTFKTPRGNVRFYSENGEILAISSPNLYPMTIQSRAYWDNNMTDEMIGTLYSIAPSGADEGWSEYCQLIPEATGTLSKWYMAKAVTAARWINDQYSKGVANNDLSTYVTEVTTKSDKTLKTPSYMCLSVEELSSSIKLEDERIQKLQEELDVSPLTYSEVYYSESGNESFDSETPFDNDAENMVLGAASRHASLAKIRSMRGGFYFSEILEAILSLINRGIIQDDSKIDAFFEESFNEVTKQAEEDVTSISYSSPKEGGLPSLGTLEDVFGGASIYNLGEAVTEVKNEEDLGEVQLKVEDNLVELPETIATDEDSPIEEISLELDEFGSDDERDAVVEEIAEGITFDFEELTDQEVIEEIFSTGNELDSSNVSPEVREMLENDLSTSEPLTENSGNEWVEEAKGLQTLVPMALSMTGALEEEVNQATVLLQENVDFEEEIKRINKNIFDTRDEYSAVITNFDDIPRSETQDTISEILMKTESLEKSRSEIISQYLENLQRLEDTFYSHKSLKELRETVSSRISQLQSIENVAYYSPEEGEEDFGDEVDMIEEAFRNGVFARYAVSLEEEAEIIARATDPYYISSKSETNNWETPIFDALAAKRNLVIPRV